MSRNLLEFRLVLLEICGGNFNVILRLWMIHDNLWKLWTAHVQTLQTWPIHAISATRTVTGNVENTLTGILITQGRNQIPTGEWTAEYLSLKDVIYLHCLPPIHVHVEPIRRWWSRMPHATQNICSLH